MANEWLKEIDDSSQDEVKPSTIIKAATTQPRGSLLLESDTVDSATRFRSYIATRQDLKEISPDATISEQPHKLVLRFIPCNGNFDPTNSNHLCEFENYNNLEAHSIASMAWCHPIEKCAANQAFATATALVTCPRVGNRVLQESIYIGDKHNSIRKDERQPLLCNKCQQ
ncbi:hypothetical protein FIBSPDRAFT_967267 [Athelia psychrophila]|uniref:Uncharacterized protein n=1 Tax=Athelia psychrophila TaxID=1759441 RepID=A0A167VWE2_9AGAM|nr:hypothetical protein FIBSPDRAFT_967267 [Fibularhizoctonia sp. CBS 109695]